MGVAGGRAGQPTVYLDEGRTCRQAPFAGARRWTKRDCGSFNYWAGPVEFRAPGCIDFFGAVRFSPGGTTYQVEGRRLHCG